MPLIDQYHKDFYADVFKLFLIGINFFLFGRYALNTEISNVGFLLIFICVIFGSLLIFKLLGLKRIVNKWIYLIIIVPLIFNAFIFINFTFSKNETTEKYSFSKRSISVGGKYQNHSKGVSTTIKLETDQYDNYYFYTTFLDYKPLVHNQKITYTFAEGFFGVRILKSYEFSR